MGRAVYITKEIKDEIRHLDEVLKMVRLADVQPPIYQNLLASIRISIKKIRKQIDEATAYRSPKEK